MASTKLIYPIRRDPSLARDRWRDQAKLAIGSERWQSMRRFIQCEALPPLASVPHASNAYDGLCFVWLEDDGISGLAGDVLAVREEVIKQGDGGGFKIHGLVVCNPQLSPAEFSRHWSEVHAPLVLRVPGARYVRRYVINHVLAHDGEPARLPFDGVAEVWFDSIEDIDKFFAESSAGQKVGRDSDELFDRKRIVTLLTNEIVLDERTSNLNSGKAR